ncbi:hypothetical protein V1477_019486 [Vespula maculifrons]|uniref:Uncharacterized protein n=1 Tax=Vespula maculifrons TaxID=7453 RepID=A0ABD2AQW0_VESMC
MSSDVFCICQYCTCIVRNIACDYENHHLEALRKLATSSCMQIYYRSRSLRAIIRKKMPNFTLLNFFAQYRDGLKAAGCHIDYSLADNFLHLVYFPLHDLPYGLLVMYDGPDAAEDVSGNFK